MQETLSAMSSALMQRQVQSPDDPNYGAIYCAACDCYHSRAAEAAFPLAVAYETNQESAYLEASMALGDWLVAQQQANGSWHETPSTMPATTVFQLLALAATYTSVHRYLSSGQVVAWQRAVQRAAQWTAETVSEAAVNLNYCASGAAALLLAAGALDDQSFLAPADSLAELVLHRIDRDGLIWGEGPYYLRGIGRLSGRGGVDPAYNLDMSLGALALYSVLSGNEPVRSATVQTLKAHLQFMYPDGSIDDSWGSRSYKWIIAGSLTAHGIQMALELLADQDPTFQPASRKNLNYLNGMMKDGLVGYGPHSWWRRSFTPCIYPTFARATALAFALRYGTDPVASPTPVAASHANGAIRLLPSVNICLIKTKDLTATISGYRPGYMRWNRLVSLAMAGRRLFAWAVPMRSDRFFFAPPSGGSMSYLWARGFGMVQAASQADYQPVEAMHMPRAGDIHTLTPHIRVQGNDTVYTSLYDTRVKILAEDTGDGPGVTCDGQLLDQAGHRPGIRFRYVYRFSEQAVTKVVTLWGKTRRMQAEIVEPIIRQPDMQVEVLADGLLLHSEQKRCQFRLLSGNAQLLHGVDADRYWSPLPDLYAYPIKLVLDEPGEVPIVVSYCINLSPQTNGS